MMTTAISNKEQKYILYHYHQYVDKSNMQTKIIGKFNDPISQSIKGDSEANSQFSVKIKKLKNEC